MHDSHATVNRTAGGMFSSNGDMAYRRVDANSLDHRIFQDHVDAVRTHLHGGDIEGTMGDKLDKRVEGNPDREDYLAYLAAKHTGPTAFKPAVRHRRTQPNPPKQEVAYDTLFFEGRHVYSAKAHENFSKATKSAISNMNSRVDHVGITKDGRTMDNGEVVDTYSTGVNVVYPMSATERLKQSLNGHESKAVLREMEARMATHKWDRVQEGRIPNAIAIASAPSLAGASTRRHKKQNLRADRSTRVEGNTKYFAGNRVHTRPETITQREFGVQREFETRTEFPTRSAYNIDQRGGNVENILPNRKRGSGARAIDRVQYGTSRQYNTTASAIAHAEPTFDYNKHTEARDTMIKVAHNRIGRDSGSNARSAQEVDRTRGMRAFDDAKYSAQARTGLREQSQRHINSSRERTDSNYGVTGHVAMRTTRLDSDLWKPGPRYMHGMQDDQVLA